MRIDEEPRDARFAECRPNLRLRKKGTKFDTYQCAACKKVWGIAKFQGKGLEDAIALIKLQQTSEREKEK